MQERTYHELGWAVRRWDGFNDRLVEPLSFCQFWRTVLLYVTIRQLLTPWRAVVRAGRRLWGPVSRLSRSRRFAPLGVLVLVTVAVGTGGTVTGADLVISFGLGIALGTVLGVLMGLEPKLSEDMMLRLGAANLGFWRGVGRGLWLLAWPFRTFFPPVGRRLVAGVVTVGEPVVGYASDHKKGLEAVGTVALVVVCVAVVGFVIVALLISNWLVTVIGFGILAASFGIIMIGVPQAAWRGFAAVMGLLWGAAVAAKHGVCPPVTITRRDETDGGRTIMKRWD